MTAYVSLSTNNKKGKLMSNIIDEMLQNGVPRDIAEQLLNSNFAIDGKDIFKRNAAGFIEGCTYGSGWQTLCWIVEIMEEDHYVGDFDGDGLVKRRVRLDVTNSPPSFLLVLNKLFKMNPLEELGLTPGESYKIRYQGGSVGLSRNDGFVNGRDIIKYSQLMRVIKELRS